MPKKPRQIHLARGVTPEFTVLYQSTTAKSSHVSALVTQYNILIDDDIDPFIDYEKALQLCDKILDAQKDVATRREVLAKYSKKSGITAEPSTSSALVYPHKKRKYLYEEDPEPSATKFVPGGLFSPKANEDTGEQEDEPPKKRVRWAETREPSNRKPRKIQRRTNSRADDFATHLLSMSRARCPSPLSSPDISRWSDDSTVVNDEPPSRKRKRSSSEGHYDIGPKRKSIKTQHDNIWPAAYSWEDVGASLENTEEDESPSGIPLSRVESNDSDTTLPLDPYEEQEDQEERKQHEEDKQWEEEVCSTTSPKDPTASQEDKATQKQILRRDHCTDLVIYRNFSTTMLLASKTRCSSSQPNIAASANCESKTEAPRIDDLGHAGDCRAMKKLQLPCSIEASMMEWKAIMI